MTANEGSDPLADAQRRKALAEAQAQALEAEKKALDAQAALDTAKKQQAAAANPSAQDKALAEAKAAKELADARKGAIDSQLAVDKSRLGGVPDSGITGKVDVAESAGKLETLLLAHTALRTAAESIAEQVALTLRKGTGKKTVYLYTAGQVPSPQAVANFAVQRKAVGDALKQASMAAQQALDAANNVEAAEAALATAGIALESITKLLGFFRSDFSVRGHDITLDDMALVQAVGSKLAGFAVRIPALFNPAAVDLTANLVNEELKPLSEQQQAARDTAQQLADHLARRQKIADDALADEAKKKAVASEIARLQALADGLRNASTAYDTLVGRLLAPDEATSAMLRDMVALNQLKEAGSLLLVLKVQASGGSSYTARNLWTILGAMPFYVAGGTVVSYGLFSGADGALLASDVIAIHGGFHGAKTVQSTVNGGPGAATSEATK